MSLLSAIRSMYQSYKDRKIVEEHDSRFNSDFPLSNFDSLDDYINKTREYLQSKKRLIARSLLARI